MPFNSEFNKTDPRIFPCLSSAKDNRLSSATAKENLPLNGIPRSSRTAIFKLTASRGWYMGLSAVISTDSFLSGCKKIIRSARGISCASNSVNCAIPILVFFVDNFTSCTPGTGLVLTYPNISPRLCKTNVIDSASVQLIATVNSSPVFSITRSPYPFSTAVGSKYSSLIPSGCRMRA